MTSRVLHDRQNIVWSLLVLATALSAALGLEEQGSTKGVSVALIAIGVIKLRLVAVHFMEVRSAPRPLRFMVDGYSVVVFAALTGIYLLG